LIPMHPTRYIATYFLLIPMHPTRYIATYCNEGKPTELPVPGAATYCNEGKPTVNNPRSETTITTQNNSIARWK
jgi:hypothetical protein